MVAGYIEQHHQREITIALILSPKKKEEKIKNTKHHHKSILIK